MADLFLYEMEKFDLEIISYFKTHTTADIKNYIDDEMERSSKTFKSAVLRRIVSYKIGKSWWLEDETICSRSKVTRELVAIWILVIKIKKLCYGNQSVEDYAQDRLADVEKDLADGKFNEQTYIEKCNWIKHLKETDEELLDCCICSPIGSMNSPIGWSNTILRIVCLPCGWDSDSTCVRL